MQFFAKIALSRHKSQDLSSDFEKAILQCLICGQYFVTMSGMIFYRKRTSEEEILETLALLVEGNRISRLTCVKGHKEDTILKWLGEAVGHAGEVEEVLMKDFWVKRGQLDAFWLYVGNKSEVKVKRLPKMFWMKNILAT